MASPLQRMAPAITKLGPGASCTVRSTGAEFRQLPSEIMAYTVMSPLTKAAGLGTGVLPGGSKAQLTDTGAPPLTAPLRVVRLKVAVPLPVSHSNKEAELATGRGRTISSTATGAEVQEASVTTAYTCRPLLP